MSDVSVRQNSLVFHVGDVVRKLRDRRAWTQDELASKAGINKETVVRFERGDGDFRSVTIRGIAAALETTVERIYASVGSDAMTGPIGASGEHSVEPGTIDVSGYRKDDLPVIAEGEANPQGHLLWPDDGTIPSEVEDRITRPFDVKDPRAYGVKVRGDSMVPLYVPGAIVVVSPYDAVSDGDRAYVQLLSGERLIKTVRKMPGGGWLLESFNPAYEPKMVEKSDVGAIHRIVWSREPRRGVRVVKDGGS